MDMKVVPFEREREEKRGWVEKKGKRRSVNGYLSILCFSFWFLN